MGGANWLTDIVRTFLSLFDRMVYWFIGLLISLFDQLATVQLFDDNIIGEFSKRIFFLVSVVMIFKVSFSIVKYIINPDTFSDKERGMGKVIQNVILVLVCLAGIGQVFTWAYDLQKRILSNHVIEKVILGVDNGVTEEEQINSKNRIPFNLLSAFITPNTTEIPEFSYDSDVGVYVCNNSISMYNVIGDGRTSYNGDNGDSWTCNTGKCATGFGGCLNTISSEKPQSKKVVTTDKRTIVGSTGEMFNEAYHSYNYALLLDLINDRYNDSTIYLFEYKFIISTVAGIFVAIMYLNFCIDLAVRAVKFGFLQLIAPIPIISMIDPKSSKSGMMSKWVKNCMNTYLGLFIRIAVVNFVVYIVNLVFSNKASIPGGEVGVFVQIVILFGALMFAKQAPKLLSDLTGIDLKGDFKMNPFSRITSVPVVGNVAKAGGAIAGGIVGAGAGLVRGGIATGAAALGSVGQGAWGLMRGRDWNFNSERVARAWRNTGHREARNAINMLNRSGQSMASIVGAKPKGMSVPYSGDTEKAYKAANKTMRQEEKAKQIYNDNTNNKTPDYEKLYKNEAFRDAVKDRDAAKLDMVEANNALAALQTRAQQGDTSVTGEMINKASKAAKDASDNYTLADNRVKDRGKIYTSDYKMYELYKQGKELSSLGDAVQNRSTQPPSNNSSNPSSNATVNAQQQASNNSNGGLTTTPSGIIIGGNSHTPISGNTGNSSNQGGNGNNLNRP